MNSHRERETETQIRERDMQEPEIGERATLRERGRKRQDRAGEIER